MIGVYSATGWLGRLVTARLDRAGRPTTLIGESEPALARLVSDCSRRTAVAAIDDAAALERAIEGCSVLVNCAPTSVSGDRLVRAALDAGIHYVDASSQQHHIRTLFEKYDDEATQCDVAVVPALGFDFAIGDCLAHLAAQWHQPAREVVIAYSVEGSAPGSNGVAAASGREVVYRDGRWRRVPLEIDRSWFTFPDPVGRRQMSRYGSGEVITVPHHVRTAAVSTLITSTSLCPYPVLLPAFAVLRPLAGLVQRTPARALLGFAAGVFGKSRSPEIAAGTAPGGPDAAPADDRPFMVAAEVHSTEGSTGRAVATGSHPEEVTAATLAQGALWLAQGSVVAGVHSAATAFEPHALLDSLSAVGVSWSQS